MAMLVRSDGDGRVQLPPGYRNTSFAFHRDPRGTIHLTPLPEHDTDDDTTHISSDPAFP